MVLGECFFMAIKEIPVQSCEWTCGITRAQLGVVGTALAVITHARDIGAYANGQKRSIDLLVCHRPQEAG